MPLSQRPLLLIIRPRDPINEIYNTTAGGSTGNLHGIFSDHSEERPMAFDGNLTTKYFNYCNYNFNGESSTVGVNTGFYTSPKVTTHSVVCSILFATANDHPNRDPLIVTLEGTKSVALNLASSWTLIYSDPTGLNPVNTPDRLTYGTLQLFSNTIAYRSYRLLVNSQCGSDNSVQYGEAHILGYY